jgi:signal transduction histidine kinase
MLTDAREHQVRGFLHKINELGGVTERFFSRIYRGLGRKWSPPEEPDQVTALRSANRELAARMRDAQNLAARLQAVLAGINEGVIVQDLEGRIVLMNNAAHQLLGSVKAFWDGDLGRLHERTRAETKLEGELQPIGSPVRVQVNNMIVGAQAAAIGTLEGVPLGTLIVLKDVTKEALADRLKDEFITQITHELRTPLTAIKGMSDVLLHQPEDRPPNRKFLEAIGRNAAILDRMIMELIDISEISAGSFVVRKDTVALDELVLDLVKGQETRTKKGKLRVQTMIINRHRLRILADDRRLRWAVGHLIDNSINYTEPGGRVVVKVGAVRGDKLLIQVTDTGVGISERDLPHIFERFYRGEARTPAGKLIDPRGLGQGLYIARAVADAHGGYLTVSSAPGAGSTFTFAIPIEG